MKILSKISSLLFNLLQKIFLFGEVFLFLRLILKFLSANPETPVVSFVFRYSDILISPFEYIFPNIQWPKGYFIETATICTMIGYAFFVFIIFQILKLFFEE